MADTTIYDVMARYRINDEARSKLGGIVDAAGRADRSLLGLQGTFAALGAVAAGGYGLGALKRGFIDFNSTIEQSKISIASVDKMFSGRTFAQSQQVAEDFFANYQQAAKASTATTEEFLQAHQMLAPALMRAGAAGKQIREIVQGSVVAAPTLGFRADVAQLDIRSMLGGTVSARDQFAQTLLQSMGVAVEEFNKRAKSDPKYALNILQQALTQPAIKEAAKAMEGSFGGVLSTLKDTLQILGGVAGKPLFSTITAELAKINEYMTANAGDIERMATAFGGQMVSGFRAVGDFLKTLAENKESLLAIAALYGGFRGVSAAAGAIGALQTSLTVLSSSAALGGASLAGMASTAAGVVGALGALYVGAQAVATLFEEWQKKDVQKQGDLQAVQGYLSSYTVANTEKVFAYARSVGAMDGIDVDRNKLAQHFRDLGYTRGDLLAQQAYGFVQGIDPYSRAKRLGLVPNVQESAKEKKRENKTPAAVKVDIHRIEVASDDPDRFAMQLVGSFRRAAERPTESAHSLPQGD